MHGTKGTTNDSVREIRLLSLSLLSLLCFPRSKSVNEEHAATASGITNSSRTVADRARKREKGSPSKIGLKVTSRNSETPNYSRRKRDSRAVTDPRSVAES